MIANHVTSGGRLSKRGKTISDAVKSIENVVKT